MELRQFLKIIQKNLILILILGFIFALGAGLYLKVKPLTYQVFFGITVSQAGKDSTSDYQYDNYYSGQAIDLFSDSLEQFFKDRQLITEVYNEAGINLADLSLRSRANLIKGRKMAPAYLSVTFSAKSPEEGAKLYQSLKTVFTAKVANLKGDQEVWYKLNFDEPLIIKNQWNPILVTIIAFILGIILGMFIALFRYYLKN